MPDKKKKLGKSVEMLEASSDEAATPTVRDIEAADALAATSPLLDALWNAQPFDEKEGEE